jgi:hypothetical protein
MPTHETDLDALARRIERLERANRRLKGIGAAVLLAASTVVLMGQAPTEEDLVDSTESEEFVLTNADGEVRARLGTDPHAAGEFSGLILYDASGRRRVRIGSDASEAPSLQLLDQEEKPRLTLGLDNAGDSTVSLLDVNHVERVALRQTRADSTVIVRDADNAVRAGVSVPADGSAAELYASDNAGRPRAILGAAADGSVSLSFADAPGKERAAIGTDASGFPSVSFSDDRGRLLATLGVIAFDDPAAAAAPAAGSARPPRAARRQASSLTLYDEQGKIIWSAPPRNERSSP